MSWRRWIRNNIVMLVAFLAAAITCFFVPVSKDYITYFDFKTLTCLFCTLAVVCALKNIFFFQTVAKKIVCVFKSTRTAILALIYITFIGSMLIANDMALLTFLPLGYFVLDSTDNKKLLSFTFVMQTVAANLGGMLTPFGNPQNLYLYSYFSIPNLTFVKIMALPFVISVVLITLCCLFFVKKEPLVLHKSDIAPMNKKRMVIYLILFAFSIAIVFRTIPYYYGLIIIPAALLLLDRKALKMVDYPLLLTFCAFFIFSGNLANIPAVSHFLGGLVQKHTLLFGVLSCQVISNVPSAILLSKFTENYASLLVAVNIGGAGTLIASLASLITLKEYTRHEPKRVGSYIWLYSVCNFSILLILFVVMAFVL
ncbi:MAG: citrate transporter [Ruminococcaceae bacterium]|nr:citrate transporter [Oscillospiraceae bacterium]